MFVADWRKDPEPAFQRAHRRAVGVSRRAGVCARRSEDRKGGGAAARAPGTCAPGARVGGAGVPREAEPGSGSRRAGATEGRSSVAMNTVLSRANSLFAFSLSVMAALTFGCFITTAFKDRSVPVRLHVSRIML